MLRRRKSPRPPRPADNSLSPGDYVVLLQNYHSGRDPWFDRPFDRVMVLSRIEGLTTLSEVEGESRKLAENQTILDSAPDLIRSPRDLAGMTNDDTASEGGRNSGVSDRLKWWNLRPVFCLTP